MVYLKLIDLADLGSYLVYLQWSSHKTLWLSSKHAHIAKSVQFPSHYICNPLINPKKDFDEPGVLCLQGLIIGNPNRARL